MRRTAAGSARTACLRCPQIVTSNPEADDRLKEVAGMPEGAVVPGPPQPF